MTTFDLTTYPGGFKRLWGTPRNSRGEDLEPEFIAGTNEVLATSNWKYVARDSQGWTSSMLLLQCTLTGSAEQKKFTGRIEEEYYHRKNGQAVVALEHGYCRGCGDTRTKQERTADRNFQNYGLSFDDIAEQLESSRLKLIDFVSAKGKGYLCTVKHLLCNKTFQVVNTTVTGQQKRLDASAFTEVLREMGILHCNHCTGNLYGPPYREQKDFRVPLWYREDMKAAYDDDKPLVFAEVAALARLKLRFPHHDFSETEWTVNETTGYIKGDAINNTKYAAEVGSGMFATCHVHGRFEFGRNSLAKKSIDPCGLYSARQRAIACKVVAAAKSQILSDTERQLIIKVNHRLSDLNLQASEPSDHLSTMFRPLLAYLRVVQWYRPDGQ